MVAAIAVKSPFSHKALFGFIVPPRRSVGLGGDDTAQAGGASHRKLSHGPPGDL